MFGWFWCTAWQRGFDITHWMHLMSTCCCCLPSPLGASVLLGSRLLWVPPHPLCVSAFLSWLLWDSLCFVRDPVSLGPSPLFCAFLSPLLWDSFCFVRIPASLGPSPYCVLLCFTVPASLGQFFAGPGLSGPFPSFLKMHVWVILMHHLTAWPWYHSLNASQEHLLLLPPGSFGSFCSVRIPASLGPSPSLVCFCFSVLASLGQLLFFRIQASLGPSPLSCAFVLYCPGFSGKAFVGPG